MFNILHFNVTHKIAQGAFAEVFSAVDTRNNTPVVVKLLTPSAAQDIQSVQLFLNEAALLQSVNHPSFPKVHGVYPINNSFAIVMQAMPGRTLRNLLDTHSIQRTDIPSVARKILTSLALLHDQNIVHGDIKPENILLDGEQLSVIDFGFARSMDGHRFTHTSTFAGTLSYASPDLLATGSHSTASDLFAVGVMLYELWHRHLPCDAKRFASPAQFVEEQQQWPSRMFHQRNQHKPFQPDAVMEELFFQLIGQGQKPLQHARGALDFFNASVSLPRQSTDSSSLVELSTELCVLSEAGNDSDTRKSCALLDLTFLKNDSDDCIQSDVVLVLDVSGSMNTPNKFPLVAQAVSRFLTSCAPNLRVGIVVFSSSAEVILPMTSGTKAQSLTESVIARISTSSVLWGGTCLAPGLAIAQELLSPPLLQSLLPSRGRTARRVYVLTDGQLGDFHGSVLALQSLNNMQVETHVYGFGTDFNALQMDQLVSPFDGSVKPICHTRDVLDTFGHIANVSSKIVGTDAEITLDFPLPSHVFSVAMIHPKARLVSDYSGTTRVSIPLRTIETGRKYTLYIERESGSAWPDNQCNIALKIAWNQRSGQCVHAMNVSLVPETFTPTVASEQMMYAHYTAKSLRNPGDSDTQKNLLRQRIAQATVARRDPGLISALESQLEVLEGTRAAQTLTTADQLYLNTQENSLLFPISELQHVSPFRTVPPT